MAIRINFDPAKKPESPTLILANRSGVKFGQINAKEIVIKDCLNNASEISFFVNKFVNGEKDYLWDKLKDFKLIYCKEQDMWFEAKVNIDEGNETVKRVSCTQLGQAELSQIKLYNIEINTETDIERDDYVEPTVLFNENNHSASLLHRLMEKAEHYSIIHVDSTIANIQRTFSFDNTSIYDAFQKIAEEINCLFIFHSDSDENGMVRRAISVYDLEANCLSCGHRGDFTNSCPECNSTDILEGYGEDTTIFVTSDELGKDIQFTSDTGAIKNCFKLEAGDDLMTATIRNCNPNGTDYIWYISDDVKEDMSNELVAKLNDYNSLYQYYQKEHSIVLDSTLLEKYNALVDKYYEQNNNLEKIISPLVGYASLMTAYYKTIDMVMYLQSEMMPDVEPHDTSAILEVQKLTHASLSPVSVTNISTVSLATANSAVLSVAKCIINPNYQVKIGTSTLNNNVWEGNFIVTSYADEEDTATSNNIQVIINDDYENFVYQKIQKVLTKEDYETIDIVALFNMPVEDFSLELKKYNISSLNSFWDMCQSCIDLLIEQGVANNTQWVNSNFNSNLYNDLYLPYYNKLKAIENEQAVRQNEINIVIGEYNADSDTIENGLQIQIQDIKNAIQQELNFEEYLGSDLWLEFCSYRREDKYSNSNYISDGLTNAEIFEKALEFIGVAEKEIYKSAELQHSISTTLQNLLVIDKFKLLVDYFEVGNWIRIQVDDKIYKLRLLDYEISYNSLDSISVTFSDVMKSSDGIAAQKSLINQATSMASSYSSVSRQAKQGKKGVEQLNNWVDKGMSLTKVKIVDSADNQNMSWDSHGILGREYLPITDSYDDKQLKIINRGLYLTNDNWETVKTGVGDFTFWNPETEQIEEDYGVIANTLVGNLILSERVGVYNTSGSINLGYEGMVITANTLDDETPNSLLTIRKKTKDSNNQDVYSNLLYLDDSGNLILNGTVRINSSGAANTLSLDEVYENENLKTSITNTITNIINNQVTELNHSITQNYKDVIDNNLRMLDDYRAEIGLYLNFGDDGVTIGGATSEFKTVMDNQSLRFRDGDMTVAYISNQQLNIINAIIQNSLVLGNYYICPESNGGLMMTWRG